MSRHPIRDPVNNPNPAVALTTGAMNAKTIEGTHPRCHWPFDEDINAHLHVRWNHRSAHKPPIPTKWDTPRHILYYSTVTAHTHTYAQDLKPVHVSNLMWILGLNFAAVYHGWASGISNQEIGFPMTKNNITHIYIYINVAACMLTNCSCLEYGWANIYIYYIYMVFLSI